MSTPLSLDLRVRVLAAVASGLSHREVGKRFSVSAASVSRWRALEREQGSACAKLDLSWNNEVAMTTLLIVPAFGSILAVFWWVIAHIGTNPAAHPPHKTAIQLDPER